MRKRTAAALLALVVAALAYRPSRRWHVVSAFVDIADALVRIVTLGYVDPGWGMAFVCWLSEREAEREHTHAGRNRRTDSPV